MKRAARCAGSCQSRTAPTPSPWTPPCRAREVSCRSPYVTTGHGEHLRNQAWRQFKDAKPFASPEEIYKHAGELIYRFELLGGPTQPYYSRPGG